MKPPNQTLQEAHSFDTEEGCLTLETQVDPSGETVVKVDGKRLTGAQIARFAGALFRAGLYSGLPKHVPIEGDAAGHPQLAFQALQSLQAQAIAAFTESAMYNTVADDGTIASKWVLQWHLLAGTQSALLQPGKQQAHKISGAIPIFLQLQKGPALEPVSNVAPIFGAKTSVHRVDK